METRRAGGDGPGTSALAFWDAPVGFGADGYATAYDSEVGAWPVHAFGGGAPPNLLVQKRILQLLEDRRHSPASGFVEAVKRALAGGNRRAARTA